ncbi:MAG: outer membrane protein assembly factor BamA [Flavobacteriales bacterium]|jgi:outer membrane protein assembly factor BamA
MRQWVLFFSMFICVVALRAQTDSTLVQGEERKNSFFGFPVAYWTPETRLGFGAATVYSFYLNKQDRISPASQIQFGAAYTLEEQVLVYLPFQLFWNERKWYSYGEVGYYKYNYYYFGTGNEDEGKRERYGVDFPRLRFNLLRKIWRDWHVGGRIWIENWETKDFEEGQRFDAGSVPGGEGGLTIDPGIIVFNDSRDNVYYPRSGWYAEFTNQHASGDYHFSRYRSDIRYYLPVNERNVFATQLFVDVTKGSTPFHMMAMLGGTKRMRGFYEGRFRDKSAAFVQTEWRSNVWRKWGVNGFLSAGFVGDNPSVWSIGNTRLAGGGGVRFRIDEERKLNLRLDVGVGDGGVQYYFTIGEAF